MYTVYIHRNKINNKVYIGITKQKPKERWGVGGKRYKDKCPCFYNAIVKYGWDNFSHDILFENLTKEEACIKEVDLIREYKAQDKMYGYNIMEGGSAPIIPLEVREKMSKAMIGNKNGEGVVFTEERKKNISQALKGKPFTEEHRKNISKAKKGKTHKPISKEARLKIAKAHKKKQVFCIETNTVYESIQECARQLGLIATSVCAVCKGKYKHTKGYHLSYYNI